MAALEARLNSDVTVVIADDHAVVLEGMHRLLSEEFNIVGTARNGRELLEIARMLIPDVVVTDLSMPELDGIAVTRQMQKEQIPSRVIVLTMHEEPHFALDAFAAGAVGYILKNSAGEELIRAIGEVLSGRTYLSSLIARDVLHVLMEEGALERVSSDSPTERLTPRQRQVLQLVAEGRSLKAMARILNISRRTVESHKYELMRSLGVSSTAELVLTAIRLGVIPAPSAFNEPAGDETAH
jgi:DNA-binding NarL/FixJ family response regulator